MENKASKKRSVIRIILIVFISVAIGVGVYNLNAESLTGNAMPMPFGIGVGVVMSGSMEPHLSVNDLIVVKECKEYSVGDWVVFQQRSMLIVHEIKSIDGDTVVTQGTANDAPDEPMNISAIKGKVIFDFAGVGSVVKWMKSPIGTVTVLLIAGFMLFKSYSSETKEKQDRAEEIDAIRKEIQRLKNSDTTDENKS